MSFKPIHDMLHTISLHTGRLDKERLIKEYLNDSKHGDLFKKVVTYTLHPFKVYNTRTVQYLQLRDDDPYLVGQNTDKIFECLDFLAAKSGCSDLENEILSKFASMDKASVDIVQRIVTKDLKCGASLKTFRKFIPELPEFNVMLCGNDLDKFVKASDNFKKAVMSIKLDGVRCWSTVTSPTGVIIHQSRNGKEFPNFDIFNSFLRDYAAECHKRFRIDYPITFDGEVESQNQDFQKLMTQIRKLQNVDPTSFKFSIFDIVLINKPFHERYSLLTDIISNDDLGPIKFLQHFKCLFNTAEGALEYTDRVCDAGYEGLVLKLTDSFYQFKRSNDWCKVKKTETTDLKVVDVEAGTGKYKDILGALICEYGTKLVRVGSGFSDEERDEFINNPPKLIEVKYQNETKDKSLRFPIFLKVREDKE